MVAKAKSLVQEIRGTFRLGTAFSSLICAETYEGPDSAETYAPRGGRAGQERFLGSPNIRPSSRRSSWYDSFGLAIYLEFTMFGLLNPGVQDAQDDTYRRVYCRCCQLQNQNYGRLSLLFHSYEAVFLYCFCIDAGALTVDSLPAQRCCKLRRGRPLHGDDAQVGQFCSSFSLLLASTKLEDDIRDVGSPKFRLLHRMLISKFEKSFVYFASLDKDFRAKTRGFVEEHMRFEAARGGVPIRDYCRPTARAFGCVFGLMAGLPGLHPRRSLLESVGELIGSAIVAFDCAVDWDRDQRTNEFNPLRTRADVQDSAEYSRDCLIRAGELCRSLPGDDLLTVRILNATSERVGRLVDQPASIDDAKERVRINARPVILYSGCGDPDYIERTYYDCGGGKHKVMEPKSPWDCGEPAYKERTYYDSCGGKHKVMRPKSLWDC